jgi:DNA primase
MRDQIIEIVQRYVRYIKMAGDRELTAPCPFHAGGMEQHPSFYMNVENGLWYCHTCHRKGTLIQFLQMMSAPNYLIDAMLEDLRNAPPTERRRPERDPGKGTNVLNEGLLGVFQYCPTDLLNEGFDEDLLKCLEIGFDRKQFRITFPIRDLYGNLVGISGRTVIGDNPRYKVYKSSDILPYAPDDPAVQARYRAYQIKNHDFLWNMHNVYPAIFGGGIAELVIVEGYKACMWLVQQGWPHTVALQGSRMSANQEQILTRLGATIYLFLDNNAAGQEGTYDTGKRLVQQGMHVRVCVYPASASEKAQPSDLAREALQGVFDATMSFPQWRAQIWNTRQRVGPRSSNA